MNNKTSSDGVKGRITRESERKKKEEEDSKKRNKTDTKKHKIFGEEALTFGKFGYR